MSDTRQIPAEGFAFDAVVQSVKTLADGGLRVTFDLPETAIDEAKLLMDCKRQAFACKVGVVPIRGNLP